MRHLVQVDGAELQVDVEGAGEPVVIIQTALDVDELRSLADRTAAAGTYRVIHSRRRGYPAGVVGRGSVAADAGDCRAVLAELDAVPAHVVGVSFSASIALVLAASYPEAVRTLTVMEPPPLEVASGAEFRAANARLLDTSRTAGAAAALDVFMTMLTGADWRATTEHDRPGALADLERDAVTFFTSDIPALLSWTFATADAARIRCPVLYVGGSDSGRWFEEVRAWVLRLLPHVESATVEGAGHLFAATHPDRTAGLLLDFLRRHPAT